MVTIHIEIAYFCMTIGLSLFMVCSWHSLVWPVCLIYFCDLFCFYYVFDSLILLNFTLFLFDQVYDFTLKLISELETHLYVVTHLIRLLVCPYLVSYSFKRLE